MCEDLVVGIDFGTTNCCVSIFENDRTTVIENLDGDRITPSYLFFAEENKIIAGKLAKSKAEKVPKNGIYEMKRLIGRKLDDPHLQNLLKYLAYEVKKDAANDPVIIIRQNGKKIEKSIIEICSILFKELKLIIENKYGASLDKAVVTVPPYFTVKQKQNILQAARRGGFSIMKLLNESTAAALCHYIERAKAIPETIYSVVYDIGGGTFDVAVLRNSKESIEVISVGGDSKLGGHDFDNIIMDYVCNEIMVNYKYDLRKDKTSMVRLHELCEEAKRGLSTMTEYEINLIGFIDGHNFITITFTKEKFEELANDLFVKTIRIVDECLKNCNINKQLIKEIILVGGSTRIPKIQEMLSDFFEGKLLSKFINPDEAVARGAAIQAAMLSVHPCQQIKTMKLVDVLPVSLGTADFVGRMEFLIERNTPLPCSVTKSFVTTYHQQSTLQLKVYEGERLDVRKNHSVANLKISGITIAQAGECEIIFKIEVNENGTLTFEAMEKFKNNVKKLKIDHARCNKNDFLIGNTITDSDLETEDKEFAKAAEARAYLTKYCNAIIENLTKRGISNKHKLIVSMCSHYKFRALTNFEDMSLLNVQEITNEIKEKCEPFVLRYKFDNMPETFEKYIIT